MKSDVYCKLHLAHDGILFPECLHKSSDIFFIIKSSRKGLKWISRTLGDIEDNRRCLGQKMFYLILYWRWSRNRLRNDRLDSYTIHSIFLALLIFAESLENRQKCDFRTQNNQLSPSSSSRNLRGVEGNLSVLKIWSWEEIYFGK